MTSSIASAKNRFFVIAPSITDCVAPPGLERLEDVPDLPELHPGERVHLLRERGVGLVPVRDGDDAVARAAGALREEEREPSASPR